MGKENFENKKNPDNNYIEELKKLQETILKCK